MNWREEIPQCVGSCKPQDKTEKVLKICKECKRVFKQNMGSLRWWTEKDESRGQYRRHYCRACGGTVCEACAIKGNPEYNCEIGEDLQRNQWVCATCQGNLVIESKSIRFASRKKTNRGSTNFKEWGGEEPQIRKSSLGTSPFVNKFDAYGNEEIFDRSTGGTFPVSGGEWRRSQPGMLARPNSIESSDISGGSGGSEDSEDSGGSEDSGVKMGSFTRSETSRKDSGRTNKSKSKLRSV